MLTAGTGGPREPPAEFRRRNRERGRHLQIHTTSVAHYGREQIPTRRQAHSAGPHRSRASRTSRPSPRVNTARYLDRVLLTAYAGSIAWIFVYRINQ
ncbi:hypothetical protein J2W14_003519 [Pseudarthrobacter oxydans]|nr:hypothetical protein [Pseudarthrobacter oxydans]